MIDNPIRKAFESIDDDATDKFREALRQRCLAELIAGDASDPRDPVVRHPTTSSFQ